MKVSLSAIYKRCKTRGECEVWDGAADQGQPKMYARRDPSKPGHSTPVRPIVYELAHKAPKPPGTRLVMTCRNSLCVKHQHMQAMTHSDAMRFHIQHGTYDTLPFRIARVRNGRTKAILTVAKAADLRALAAAPGADRQALAAEYGVSVRTVCAVANGERWGRGTVIPNASVFHMAA